MYSSRAILWALCARAAVAQTFSLSFSAPTQCNEMNVSWTGGTPPFDLYLTPVYGTPRNISVPASAWNDGRGSYSVQVPFPKGQQMLLSLLDATGVPSGGTSELLTVGANVGGMSCNTTDPGVDFYYELNTPLVQCQPYTFSNYTNAVQPVEVMAFIPAKNPMLLHPPNGPTSYNWTANITAGTSVIFVMTDSRGRQGGASNVLNVGYSSNFSCLNVPTTSSGLVPPTQTSSPSSDTSPTTGETTTSNNSTLTVGAIAGIIIGCLAAAGALALALFFWWRRRRARSPSPRRIDLDLAQDALFPRMSQLTPGVYEPTPYLFAAPPSAGAAGEQSPSSPPTASVRTSYDDGPRYLSPTSSSRARKVSEVPSSSRYSTSTVTRTPSHVLVHQDAEDILSPDEEFEYVELPPQYREDRRPLSVIPATPAAVPVHDPMDTYVHPDEDPDK
ncbi:hypothetical protein OE88DRAFT_1334483 [Heliocybe sulcata]|uniref:Mid2 domain-containing protein n=1 Tax=Heliocybe sulcata TaxID=5364 RepID=A0A5C3N730_9AGAM|nr:hypothetical protein OE88DRAFT_1334483 [Heliocybe sulcata]